MLIPIWYFNNGIQIFRFLISTTQESEYCRVGCESIFREPVYHFVSLLFQNIFDLQNIISAYEMQLSSA